MDVTKLLLSEFKNVKKDKDLYILPYQINLKKRSTFKPKITLFCLSCYGFGDIIFCLKIFYYIKKWYNITPTIVTSKPLPFIMNGVKLSNLLGAKIPGKKYDECDNYTKMKVYKVDKAGKFLKQIKTNFDLIFVTPWIGSDYTVKYSGMKSLFPYSNQFNTFIFSEYNPEKPHLYDFPTGIGKNLLGVFITKITKTKRIYPNPYIMVHITEDANVNVGKCFNNFIKLMAKKYHNKHKHLDVILPKHVIKDNVDDINKLIKYIIDKGWYDKVEIIETKEQVKKQSNSEKILRLRIDAGFKPLKEFVGLYNHCLPDVLITGDQSLSDILSCCKKFNIYYQIMPWKANLAKNLSKVTKLNYLSKLSTSCGLEKMPSPLKNKLQNVIKYYNFKNLAKPKLDLLIKNAGNLKNKEIQKYMYTILHSRKLKKIELKKKLSNM